MNLKILIKNVLSSSLHTILDIKYFTATPKKADSAQRQLVYLNALRKEKDINIIFGQFKKRQIKGKDMRSKKIVNIEKWEEKQSDVNIASHILYDCYSKEIDCIALLSNDTDLITPLKFAKYKLKKKIVIITPTKRLRNPGDNITPRKSHIELRKISNVNLSISEDHLRKSQFPKKVNGVFKPKNWT